MRLETRLAKLETVYKEHRTDPNKEASEKDFRDWINNDQQAGELLKQEYKYCVSKGYPTDNQGFLDTLDDPVLQQMNREVLAAFDEYMNTRRGMVNA